MDLTPEKILEEFQKKNLNTDSAVELLTSLIENSNDEIIRLESFKILEKIGAIDNKSYKLIENLLISDSSWELRNAAALCISKKFQEKALEPLKWALQHEQKYDCLITIINSLVRINTKESKSILIDEVEKIRKKKYLFSDLKITNKAFKKEIKKLLKVKSIVEFSHEDLADIIINYKTIIALKKKFFNVYYELDNARVKKLDLSDVEYEVRGWKSEFNNNITDLSEITGLANLAHLTHLYLSNNKVSNIKELTKLHHLSFLHISSNSISDVENIEYIKQMTNKNLKSINIYGNTIANLINPSEFKPDVELVTRNPAHYWIN
jgi:hypothetical protein